MDVDPDATAKLDQLLAALRDCPQGLLERLDGAVLDFALEMNRRGVPPSQLHGLLHGLLAEALTRMEATFGGESHG